MRGKDLAEASVEENTKNRRKWLEVVWRLGYFFNHIACSVKGNDSYYLYRFNVNDSHQFLLKTAKNSVTDYPQSVGGGRIAFQAVFGVCDALELDLSTLFGGPTSVSSKNIHRMSLHGVK